MKKWKPTTHNLNTMTSRRIRRITQEHNRNDPERPIVSVSVQQGNMKSKHREDMKEIHKPCKDQVKPSPDQSEWTPAMRLYVRYDTLPSRDHL